MTTEPPIEGLRADAICIPCQQRCIDELAAEGPETEATVTRYCESTRRAVSVTARAGVMKRAYLSVVGERDDVVTIPSAVPGLSEAFVCSTCQRQAVERAQSADGPTVSQHCESRKARLTLHVRDGEPVDWCVHEDWPEAQAAGASHD